MFTVADDFAAPKCHVRPQNKRTITLHELLCYQCSLGDDNNAALVVNTADLNRKPSPLDERVSDCPSELEWLVGRMLQKDIDEGPRTTEEVLFGIEPLCKKFEEASTPSQLPRAAKTSRAAVICSDPSLQTDSRKDRSKKLLEQVNRELSEPGFVHKSQSVEISIGVRVPGGGFRATHPRDARTVTEPLGVAELERA